MSESTAARLDRRQLAKAVSLGAVAALAGGKAFAAGKDLDNIVYMQLKYGRVVIRLRPDLAPKTVAQIKTLVKQGFYNGLIFHRVIDGFMAQTGDPTGTGMGGSKLPDVPAEFTDAPFKRGTVGMARASDPNSGNSQFFICFAPAPFLDGKYTVFGQVISGMKYVDKIKRGSPPPHPDKIISMTMASDAKK